jgi:dinuclear metal center YbgI/SA1388 family protein
MSVKVKDIMGVMENIAPKHLAEGWDNVGLAIGDPEREVTKILVALDVIDPVVEEAKEIGAEMIVTHHPMLLFKKIESITTQNTLGKRIYNLIENGIAAFSAHTNLDIAKGGTNDVLAELAGLTNIELLEDLQVENSQFLDQAMINSQVLSGLMDARASVINNNLNVMMKNMNAIVIAVAVPTFFTGVFGMSEFTMMSKEYWYIAYPLFVALMIMLGFFAFWLIKKYERH